MADPADIERIAKILARGTSDNAAEAETAIRHAYGRMLRDGVTFGDLLSLPKEALYQTTLSRLAEIISRELKPELSENAKRDIYAELLRLIVEKFTGSTKRTEDRADSDREKAAREYEARRREEEARRGRSEPPPKPGQGGKKAEPPPKDTGEEKAQSRQNAKPATDAIEPPFHFDASKVPLSLSPATYFAFLLGPNSCLLYTSRCV